MGDNRFNATLLIIAAIVGGLTSEAIHLMLQPENQTSLGFVLFFLVIIVNWTMCLVMLWIVNTFMFKKRKD